MKFRSPILLFSVSLLLASCSPNARYNYNTKPLSLDFFNRRDFTSACTARPGQYRLKSFPSSLGTDLKNIQIPKTYAHLDQLTLPVSDIPALTITADMSHRVEIAGSPRDSWSLAFCAEDQETNEEEAKTKLKQYSMTRVGGMVSLAGPDFFKLSGSRGTLIIDAPASAPIVVHASWAAVDIRDMAGPVRVTATHGRATLLNTTGKVDADGQKVDFAGSKGELTLTATDEMNLEMTAQRFDGFVNAWSKGPLRILVPSAFQTPFEVMIERPRDFICRAGFCSQMKQSKNAFVYRGDGSTPSARVFLRSDQAVLIDATN